MMMTPGGGRPVGERASTAPEAGSWTGVVVKEGDRGDRGVPVVDRDRATGGGPPVVEEEVTPEVSAWLTRASLAVRYALAQRAKHDALPQKEEPLFTAEMDDEIRKKKKEKDGLPVSNKIFIAHKNRFAKVLLLSSPEPRPESPEPEP